ncbi:MAG: ERCC4 domain-containing protein [candidate division WOR-3 bacterium]
MQSTLKTNNIFVLADDRESKSNVCFYLKEFGANVSFKRLEVGDFLVSDNICIERKSSNDFINSIIDGRLFEQAENIKNNFKKGIIMIEGNNADGRITENALKASIATVIVKYDLDVLRTENEKETARMIYYIAKKEQEQGKSVVIKGKRKGKQIDELQLQLLCSLPGISNGLSKKITEKFSNIKEFVNADQDEIRKIKGLGKTNAKKIYDIFNQEWKK